MKISDEMKYIIDCIDSKTPIKVDDNCYRFPLDSENEKRILLKYFPKVEALEKALEEIINGGYCIHHMKCEPEKYCVLNFSYDDCPIVKAKDLL